MLTSLRLWFERYSAMRELRNIRREDHAYIVREVAGQLRDIKDAIAANDFSRAGNLWDKVHAEHPKEALDPRSTLQILIDLKRFDDAEALADARRKRVSHQSYEEDYAYVAHQRGDFAEAVRRWEAVRKRYPSWKSYADGANALTLTGRQEEAKNLLYDGIARFPEQIEIRIELGRLLTGSYGLEEALRQWTEIRDKFGHPIGYDGMVNCLHALERYDEEFAVLKEAVVKFPTIGAMRAALAAAEQRRLSNDAGTGA